MVPPPPKEFLFPYSFAAQLRQYPFKWYWKNGRMLRFHVYAYVLCFPLFWKIDKLVHSPANVEEWKQRRAARDRVIVTVGTFILNSVGVSTPFIGGYILVLFIQTEAKR